MLRMGKNPKADQGDSEHTTDNPATQRPTPSNYAPYQSAEVPPRPATDTGTTIRAVTESEMLAREIKEGNLSGFVGNGTTLTGEANFKAMLRVDGHLSGRISSDSGTLIVGTGGQVDANIEVAIATIHGTVNGDIIAKQRLELGRAARVTGNIQTPSLVIEQGAIFEGSCRMMQPKADLDKRQQQSQTRDNGAATSNARPVAESTVAPTDVANVSDMPS